MEDESLNLEISELFEDDDIDMGTDAKKKLRERYAEMEEKLDGLKKKYAELEGQVKEKYAETRDKIKTTVDEVGFNPYIKTSCDCRVEVFKSKGDEEPARTFEKRLDFGCAARTVAIAGASACVLIAAVGILSSLNKN